jgi:DNA replication protein DnaC
MSQTSDLERSGKLLTQLGWTWAGQRLAELIERAVREKLSLHAFLELVAEAEHEARETHRITGWLKRSGLPVGKTLENFDFTFAHGVDRRKVELLATCEFATRHETVLVLGPSGIGKTHLAAGLAVKAITNGFGVWFVTADDLTQMLHRDEQAPASRIRQRRYLTAKVLVIDELGFQVLDRGEAHRLFRLINQRYERASTIITSNKSIRDWPTILAGDEALATAILDRLLHHCHVLSIDGPSYRLRHLESQLSQGQ